jgi:hypothetical protein
MILFLLLVQLLFAGFTAEANVGEAYGFGSRTGSLAGAGAAWGFGAYAAYDNPAGLPLALPEGKRVGLDLGVLLMDPRFTPIENVTIENEYVSDKQRLGNVDTAYRSTFGQVLGVAYQFPESSWALGLTAFLPVNQFAYLDSGETFIPEYVLYRARTQRPQLNLALGKSVTSKVHVGAGLYLALSVTANGTLFLNANPNNPSTMRFSSIMKPKASPYLGVLVTPLENKEKLSLGAVLRFPAATDVTMVLNSGARLLGVLAALDFNFTALSSLVYDPWTIELGGSWTPNPKVRVFAQLDYQVWRKFEAPALQIQTPEVDSCKTDPNTQCGIALSGGKNPSFPLQNIVIPRLAAETTYWGKIFRAGYAYRPSIFNGVPQGIGNYLDPPKHMFSVGMGMEFPKFLGTDIPARLDTHLAYHLLQGQQVVKTPGNEAGNAADAKIGSPGYDVGGKVLGGGVSLSLSI